MKIDYKLLNPALEDKYSAPQYATDGSAAMDLRAMMGSDRTIQPGETLLISTGIAINLKDSNVAAIILPRSGLGHKQGIILGNGTGLIDSDYQGELFMSIHNRSKEAYRIEVGERVAQLLILPIISATLNKVENFDSVSGRGAGGFGHSGKGEITKVTKEVPQSKDFNERLTELQLNFSKLNTNIKSLDMKATINESTLKIKDLESKNLELEAKIKRLSDENLKQQSLIDNLTKLDISKIIVEMQGKLKTLEDANKVLNTKSTPSTTINANTTAKNRQTRGKS